MRIELCDCTNVLLREIYDSRFTQKDIAITYAMALCSTEKKNWATINAAIVKRWSRSGLERIKRMAWERIEKP